MNITRSDTIQNVVMKAIQEHIDKVIKEVVEEHKKDAMQELEIKIREAVLSVSVTLSRRINIRGVGDILEIRLDDTRGSKST